MPAVELSTATTTSQAHSLTPVASASNTTVVTSDKPSPGYLRPRLESHPVISPGPKHLAVEATVRAKRRSVVTSRTDDVMQAHPVTADHLRVHTGTGARSSRSFIRFPVGGRNSIGAAKMHGRERRAGRTLIWVFAVTIRCVK